MGIDVFTNPSLRLAEACSGEGGSSVRSSGLQKRGDLGPFKPQITSFLLAESNSVLDSNN